MRVLVTGGTGYLGRAIVRAVADRGHEPVVFARHATRARLPGRAIDGDVRDRAAFEAAARGVDAICHSAALVSVWRRDPAEFDKINVGGLENAIAITRALTLPRLIYTSSFLALPPPDRTTPLEANDYQRTKVAAHRVAMQARDAGVPIVAAVSRRDLRPGRDVGRQSGRPAARRSPRPASCRASSAPIACGPSPAWTTSRPRTCARWKAPRRAAAISSAATTRRRSARSRSSAKSKARRCRASSPTGCQIGRGRRRAARAPHRPAAAPHPRRRRDLSS